MMWRSSRDLLALVLGVFIVGGVMSPGVSAASVGRQTINAFMLSSLIVLLLYGVFFVICIGGDLWRRLHHLFSGGSR